MQSASDNSRVGIENEIDNLVSRMFFSIALSVGIAAIVVVLLLDQAVTLRTRLAMLAALFVFLAALAGGTLLSRRKLLRASIALVLLAGMAAVSMFPIASGMGVHAAVLGFYGVITIAAGVLLGERAALAFAAISAAALVGFYAAENSGLLPGIAASNLNPGFNRLLTHLVLVGSALLFAFLFSRIIMRSLRGAMQEEYRFRRLFEIPPVAYVIHRGGRVLLANDAMARLVGAVSPSDLVGRRVVDLVRADGRAYAEEQMALAQQLGPDGVLRRTEHRLVRSDGREVVVESANANVDMPDGPAVLSVLWDVSEKRRAAEELAAAKEQAEAASRAKSEFLATMSHEIRTPLGAVIGLADLALDPELESEKRRYYLEKIRESSQLLTGIITDVLDLSKIEAGKLSIERAPFNLVKQVEGVRSTFGALASEKGVAFSVRIAPEVPQVIVGDALRVRQVLSNFASNAVKFTDRGRVEVEVAPVRPDWLRIKVLDTGIGIDAEAQRRLFKPFTQADGSTARRFGGSGLGLALCRQLVEMMGGSIGMKSTPGEGSAFWAELPLPAAGPGVKPAEDGVRDRRHESRFDGVRVLLVEDNDVNRLVASAILARAGIDVVEAVDGTTALRCIEREAGRLDAVLLDIQMPDLDGHEVAAAIRRRADAKTLPIIALTAAALASEKERSLASGMNDFLTKPIDPDKLFEVLGRWIAPRTVKPGAR